MSILAGVLIGLVAGLLIGAFLDEIIAWGRSLFEQYAPQMEKAKLYIKKIGNQIHSFWRYLTNEGRQGKIERKEPHKLTKEELEDLKVRCPELYKALMAGDEVEVETYANEN